MRFQKNYKLKYQLERGNKIVFFKRDQPLSLLRMHHNFKAISIENYPESQSALHTN